jgi:hypothetical protein
MTPQESAAWWQADALIRGERHHAVSPCSDCSLRFAEGMRLVNRCDGHYPGEFGPAPISESRGWRYSTEEERIEARRRSWRDQSRRRSLLRQATA